MTTRREFLSDWGTGPAGALDLAAPLSGSTIRLGKTAMASDFEVVLNPAPGASLVSASRALELVDQLEDQMSIYRPQSELSRLNAAAAQVPVPVERRLFELLRETVRYARETEGAFDPTTGPLVALWRRCRDEKRPPSEAEVQAARERLGWRDIAFDEKNCAIQFPRAGIELNLNAIGKGYALDRAGEVLDGVETPEDAVEDAPFQSAIGNPQSAIPSDWLMHGGHSSILARGSLAGHDGWPIALRHPLFANRPFGMLWLKNRGMSTSGSGVQFFRAAGRRFGHILDPRTGWPADGMLCAIVLAPTAAQAEALSTAFFVLGVEKAREYCHNHTDVAALLVPAPSQDERRLAPVNCGICETDLLLDPDA